jgi:hypothetical protein
MTEEKVINIEELTQDEHNFNKGTEGGGRINGTLPQRAGCRPKHPD